MDASNPATGPSTHRSVPRCLRLHHPKPARHGRPSDSKSSDRQQPGAVRGARGSHELVERNVVNTISRSVSWRVLSKWRGKGPADFIEPRFGPKHRNTRRNQVERDATAGHRTPRKRLRKMTKGYFRIRAPAVSKTGGRRFEPCHSCHLKVQLSY
jgi:hypothetical protein